MKKVFIVHGLSGTPNGGWRPWLMAEMEKKDIYCCALPMPTPDAPICEEWIKEIRRHITKNDEIYLIGHSLGVPAILNYLESKQAIPIAGAILVSGPIGKTGNKKVEPFLNKEFDFSTIKKNCPFFTVIHGENDEVIPMHDGQKLSAILNCPFIIVENGQHLNGSAGWFQLPQCLEALEKMIKISSKENRP